MNLIKMQILYGVIVVIHVSCKVSLATIGVCVFCAVYFGSRTFYFRSMRNKMSNHSQVKNQNIKNTNEEDAYESIPEELRILIKRAYSEAVQEDICDTDEEINIHQYSKRHKIRMNRVFRERVGGTFLPFPEADNFYERIRSKIVIKLKINEFLAHRKKRRIEG